MTIDARNGCWGNEEDPEATADDGINFVGAKPLGSARRADNNGVSVTSPPEAPKYDGNLLPAMTAMVTGFVDKLAKFYSPCPQGDDCVGDGKHYRIFACDHCSFVGCCACLDEHEAGGHESDSSHTRERYGYEY